VREKLNLDTERAGGPKALLVEFLTALKENRQPECNAEDNLKSMGMVFAAVKSAKEKREVSLSEL
jgi:predicted dehydrogenase